MALNISVYSLCDTPTKTNKKTRVISSYIALSSHFKLSNWKHLHFHFLSEHQRVFHCIAAAAAATYRVLSFKFTFFPKERKTEKKNQQNNQFDSLWNGQAYPYNVWKYTTIARNEWMRKKRANQLYAAKTKRTQQPSPIISTSEISICQSVKSSFSFE